IYPQLEVTGYAPERVAARGRAAAPLETRVVEESAKATARADSLSSVAVSSVAVSSVAVSGVAVSGPRGAAAEPILARYAPGTLLQAGPGIPAWNYGAHPFGWTGPVDPDQTLRFVVLGPLAVALWRIA